MWATATRVVVWNEEDEAMAVRTPGVAPGVVEIASRPPSESAVERSWPSATNPDLREATLAEIRARADRDRQAIEGRALVGAGGRSG